MSSFKPMNGLSQTPTKAVALAGRGGRAEELRAEKGQTPLKKTGGHRSVLR